MAMSRFQCGIYHADNGEGGELGLHQVPLALKFVTGRLPHELGSLKLLVYLCNFLSQVININEIRLSMF